LLYNDVPVDINVEIVVPVVPFEDLLNLDKFPAPTPRYEIGYTFSKKFNNPDTGKNETHVGRVVARSIVYRSDILYSDLDAEQLDEYEIDDQQPIDDLVL
jgi:hypothetical protein